MKLAIGTAQFGLNYGISNNQGQVCPNEVSKILALAKHENINTLDTAPAYGDSEKVLGETGITAQFDIVSKIPALGNCTNNIEQYVNASLQQLNIETLSAVLFHQVEDIISSTHAKSRFNALLALKKQNKINKIGISVYTPEQLKLCVNNYPIDIVQLPLNCFDQRFINTGWLEKLADKKIEIHTRSIFLQGLLLMKQKQLPAYFSIYKSRFQHFIDTAHQLNVSTLSLALAIGCQQNHIDKIIVGCCNVKQLQEIISAYNIAKEIKTDLSSLSCSDENLIIPSNWQ